MGRRDMRFAIIFYLLKLSHIALFFVAAVVVAAFFDAPLPAGRVWPNAEQVLFGLIAGVFAVAITSSVLYRRRTICPKCGNGGEIEIDRFDASVACAKCGYVGGHLLKDWTMKVHPPGNPTRDWRRDERLPLVVDCDRGALCGVPLGAPMAALVGLGPVEHAPSLREGDHLYNSLGVEFFSRDGLLDQIAVYGRESDDPEFAPFAGRIVCRGESLAVDQIQLARITELFGEPVRTEECDGQFCLHFEQDSKEIELEFSAKGNLGMLLLSTAARNESR
jgi:ribosomal protein S27AE